MKKEVTCGFLAPFILKQDCVYFAFTVFIGVANFLLVQQKRILSRPFFPQKSIAKKGLEM